MSQNKINIPEAIKVNGIKRNPYQYRELFDPDKLQELSEDIANNGVKEAIEVLIDTDTGKTYLISGERRLTATRMAKISEIPALVYKGSLQKTETQKKLKKLAYKENHYSVAPTLIEEGIGFREVLRPTAVNNYRPLYETHEQLAEDILGYNELKKLSEDQVRIRRNKIKEISKRIRKYGRLTDYIENHIEAGELNDRYLLIKIAELGKSLDIPTTSVGSLRKKTPTIIKTNLDKKKIDIVNNIYEHFNSLNEKPPYFGVILEEGNPASMQNLEQKMKSWRQGIDEKISNAAKMIKEQPKETIPNSFNNEVISYEKIQDTTVLNINSSKIKDDKIKKKIDAHLQQIYKLLAD